MSNAEQEIYEFSGESEAFEAEQFARAMEAQHALRRHDERRDRIPDDCGGAQF